jgi:hypothetical protein
MPYNLSNQVSQSMMTSFRSNVTTSRISPLQFAKSGRSSLPPWHLPKASWLVLEANAAFSGSSRTLQNVGQHNIYMSWPGSQTRVPRKRGGRYTSLSFRTRRFSGCIPKAVRKSAIEMGDGRGGWEDFFLGRQGSLQPDRAEIRAGRV